MATLIAFANIHTDFPFSLLPKEIIPQKLMQLPQGNERVKQRHHCRQLAYFLLWELCKTEKIPTALLADIYRTSSGRPEFPVEHIDFNISHSGDWVAVILNVASDAKCAVGIDIEHCKKARNYTALLQHFAAPKEQDWFSKQTNSEQAFYQIWCLREAVLKSQGVGIVKLSEVEHQPEALTLHSAHCPSGQLIFTSELPFYLAVFAEQNALEQAQFFHWNGQLTPYFVKSAVNYEVNFDMI